MRAGAARATASSERSHGPVISADAVRTNNPKAMSQTKARDLREYRMERHSGNPKRRGTKTNYPVALVLTRPNPVPPAIVGRRTRAIAVTSRRDPTSSEGYGPYHRCEVSVVAPWIFLDGVSY